MLRLIASDFLFVAIFLLASCTDLERNNPDDTGSINYVLVQAADITYEGETYKTVVIGEQTWMARNLNYDVEGSKCYGEGDEGAPADIIAKNCATYGRLYNWATAMKLDASCNTNSCASQISTPHQGICPTGWHIPSDDDWNTLMTAVGGDSTAGTKLKAKEGWYIYIYGNGKDEFGFSALPGGYKKYDSSFVNVNYTGLWWSTSEYNSHNANHRYIDYSKENVGGSPGGKRNLFSVRCVKDSGGTMPGTSSSSVGGGTSPSSSSSNTINQNGECNAFCEWEESGCVPISTDPTGFYGTVIRTCEEAFSNCLKYSPSKQLHSTDKCNGGYINPNITKSTFTDIRDGKSYEFVTIGNQTWMAQNLNYNDKDNTSGSKCYKNSENNCTIYGRLYNWETAKTACPDGWHLPSDAEWDALVNSAGRVENLKATSGWNSNSGNGLDKYGFSALPGGYDVDNVYSGARWWTATADEYTASVRYMSDGMVNFPTTKSNFFSVRCLQNN